MPSALGRLSRAFTLLGALVGLGACVAQPYPYGYGPPMALAPSPAPPSQPGPAQHRMAILVPLTGANAELGRSLLNAAQLATDQKLDSEDTGGTPDGAARAARSAIAAGAPVLLGPLTAGETAAVSPIARAAGVPDLAFTSDRALALPGVWTMGITPGQQVETLVRAVRAENKTRLAAVLPDGAFGDALARGLVEAAGEAGLPPPQIVRHPPTASGLEGALREVAGDPAETPPTAPPPVDALLIGASGDVLLRALPTLTRYGLGPDRVRLLGTALWARDAPRLGALAGAWFAAPDPAMRAAFEKVYASRYGAPPRDLASIAFDAAAAARAVMTPNGIPAGALLRPDGFAGAGGVFALLPDGRVRRGLAVFEIDAGGAHVVQPAPRSLTQPGA